MANLSETVLARIGAVTVAFSDIERNLQLLVWDLIGSGQRIGRAITAASQAAAAPTTEP